MISAHFSSIFLIYALCIEIYTLSSLIFPIDNVSILSFPAKPTSSRAQYRSIGPFPFPLDNPTLIEYSFSDRTRETLVKSQSLMRSMLPLWDPSMLYGYPEGSLKEIRTAAWILGHSSSISWAVSRKGHRVLYDLTACQILISLGFL